MTVKIDKEKCVSCAGCVGVCPALALDFIGSRITVNNKCIDCGKCVKFCPVGAIKL